MQNTKTTRILLILGAVLILAGGYFLFRSIRSTGINSHTATTTSSGMSDSIGTNSSSTSTTTPPSGSNSSPGAISYGRVTLKIGETASFKDISITPTKVSEDSRCPKDVQCIQAGTVKVALNISSGLGRSTETILLGKSITTEAENIEFVSASPDRLTNKTISQSDYRLTFDVTKRAAPLGKCYVGGCSSQICSDQEGAISTCEYRAEYACYKTATCERQQNGQCGWTKTSKLSMCLNNPPAL